jgi:predicted aconitase
VGRQVTNYWDVPVIVAEDACPSVDDLKHLGAALASYGSYALFHLVGVTPEAPDVATALGGREPAQRLVLERGALQAVFDSFAPRKAQADLVVFTAPQLSIHELHEIAGRLRGKRVHAGTRLVLTVSPQVRAEAQRLGYAAWVEEAGGILASGVCFYVMMPELMRERFGWETLVTNSAKLANIIEGSGYNPVLRRLEPCIEAALSGRIP